MDCTNDDDKFKIWQLYAVWHLSDYKIREYIKNGSFAVPEEEWEKCYALNWGKALKEIPDWDAKVYFTDKGIWKRKGYVFVVM